MMARPASIPLLLSALLAAGAAGCAGPGAAAGRDKDPFPIGGEPRARPAAQAPAEAGSAPAATTPAEAPAPRPLDVRTLDPKTYIERYPRAQFCEEQARKVLKLSREKGWAVLRACVERGNFTLIKPLVDGTWDEELRGRSDASFVLLKVVAARGGDVNGDLDKLRQRKVPVFDLQAASRYPDVYKGRLLMVRAEVVDVKTASGKTTLRLMEKGFSSYQKWMDVTDSRAHRGTSGTYFAEKKMGFNEIRETGLQALARLKDTDPFLVPGRDFLFLARFEGVRESDNEWDSGEAMPVLTVVTYMEPAPQIVE